jgi:hypothetical protein
MFPLHYPLHLWQRVPKSTAITIPTELEDTKDGVVENA